MARPRVVLVGPPGSGKTTVGAALAQHWGVALRDSDRSIESAQDRSVSDIFVDDGEAAFRSLERAEVLAALSSHDGVLALGGGAVMDPDVREALSEHRVVFLDVGIADASGRIGFDVSRPLLLVNPRASWIRLMNERRPSYEAVATVRVDTAQRTVEEVTVAVLEALGES